MKKIVLMPRGTALWLKIKTKLTPEQIMEFCNIDVFTLESINLSNTTPSNPVEVGQLTEEEIEKGEKNGGILKNKLQIKSFSKLITKKYVSFKNRGTKREGAIAFLLEKHPEVDIKKIAKLLGTTTPYVSKIKTKLKEGVCEFFFDPILENVCTKEELNLVLFSKK